MKKIILLLAVVIGLCYGVYAQQPHRRFVEVYDYDEVKVHLYSSFKAMEDISLIVEGKRGLVVLEPQAYTHCKEDFETYVREIGKPVVKIISDYHTYGLADWDPKMVVMVESMVPYEKSAEYKERTQRFASIFKGDLDVHPHDKVATIPAKSTQMWAGISFQFEPGLSTDYPASTINIAGKFYYMHYTPELEHLPASLFKNAASMDLLIAELQKAKESGCMLFIGSHGRASYMSAVEFLLKYLEKMKSVYKVSKTKSEFIRTMTSTFYGLPEEHNLIEVADILYKK